MTHRARGVRGQDVSPAAWGNVPSAGPPLPALPEHDRVLVETADLPRWVLAANPGSSAWIHRPRGRRAPPAGLGIGLRVRAAVSHHSQRSRTWKSPDRPDEAQFAMRALHRAPQSLAADQAPAYLLIGYLRGSLRPPARVWRTQDADQRSPCPPAHATQNAQIWTDSAVMGIEPTPAQIESLFVSRGSVGPFRGVCGVLRRLCLERRIPWGLPRGRV